MGIIESQDLNLPVATPTGAGTIQDYMSNFNTGAIVYDSLNKDSTTNLAKEDPNFRLNEFIIQIGNITPDELTYLQEDKPLSTVQANDRLTTYRADMKSMQRMGGDSFLKALSYTGAAVGADPITYVPFVGWIEKAGVVAKATYEARNVLKALQIAKEAQPTVTTFGRVATVGAVEGAIQEGIVYEAQKATGHDVLAQPNNILLGGALGGGFSVLFKGLGQVFSKGTQTEVDALDKGLNTKTDIHEVTPDNVGYRFDGSEAVDIPSINLSNASIINTTEEVVAKEHMVRENGVFTRVVLDNIFGFLNSDSVKTTNSLDPMLTELSVTLKAPSFNMYNKDTEELVAPGLSHEDIVTQLNGDSNILFSYFRDSFKTAKESGFPGNYEAYVNDIWKQGVIEKSTIDNAVYGSQEYRHIKEVQKAKEPFVAAQADAYVEALRVEQLKTITKQVDTKYAAQLKETRTPREKNQLKEAKAVEKETLRKELSGTLENERINFIKLQQGEYVQQLEDIFKKYSDDIYSKSTHPLKEQSAKIKEHFKNELELGKKLGVPELARNLSNRHYFTRKFDYDAIEKLPLEELTAKLSNAIKTDPYNVRFNMTKDADIIAADMANELKRGGFDRAVADYSYVVPKSLPVSPNFRGRNIHMDDSKVLDILDTNAESNINTYGYWNHRQFALRQVLPKMQGKKTDELFKTWQEEYVNKLDINKVTPAELNAINGMFKDAMGVLAKPGDKKSFTWGAAHIATATNSLLMLANTGIVALTELATALWATSMKKMFFKEFAPAFKDASKFMVTGKAMDNPMMHSAMIAGNLLDTIHVHKGSEEFIGPMNSLEKGLQKMLGVMYIGNGMRALTASLETTIFSNLVGELATIGHKLGTQDLKRYARLGLTSDDLLKVRQQLETHSTKNSFGVITDVNLPKWDKDTRLKFQVASRRAVESGVIQGNTKDLPRIMREGHPATKILTQFLRVPLAAHNTMLRRGVDGEKAGLVAAAMGAMGIYMGTQLLLDEARGAMGYEKKYDVDDEESITKLFGISLKYATSFGMFTDVAVRVNSFSGGDWVGEDRKNKDNWLVEQIPTAGTIERVHKTITSARENGVKDTHTLKLMKQLTPANNLVLWSDFLNKSIEENGE